MSPSAAGGVQPGLTSNALTTQELPLELTVLMANLVTWCYLLFSGAAPFASRNCPPAQSGGTCSNESRTLQQAAGIINEAKAGCTQLSFTIVGQSMETPAECTIGYAQYHESVYSCGPSAQCVDCDPKGHQADIDSFSGGGCPDLSELLQFIGGSWDDYKDVPEAVIKALSCTPPKKSSTYDDSASVQRCPDCGNEEEATELESGVVYQGAGDSHYLFWTLSLDGLVGEDSFNPMVSVFDLAQTASPADIGGTFGEVLEAHGTLSGTNLSASVEIAHFENGGGVESAYEERLSGRILATGQFDLRITTSASKGGRQTVLDKQVTFNGMALTALGSAWEAGNVYTPDSEAWDLVFSGQTAAIQAVYDWMCSPYSIPKFQDMDLVELETTSGDVVVQRRVPGPDGPWKSSEYLFERRQDVVLPARSTTFDPLGRVREECLFRNYRQVGEGSGALRPFTVIREMYLDGSPDGRRIRVTVNVHSAEGLDEEQAQTVPTLPQAGQAWRVWQ